MRRALASLPRDLNLAPSILPGRSRLPVTPAVRDFTFSSGLQGQGCATAE